MEFGEKLQELRKNKGLTQEELAEVLYVSRTAVSKWESGRGYPNIDSLKEISRFFSVSIDELLSSEKLLSIAEGEKKSNIRNLCNMLSGAVDLFSVILIILPLYPNIIDEFVYSVNLMNYTQVSQINKIIYWVIYIVLLLLGIFEIIFVKTKKEKSSRLVMNASVIFNAFAVVFLALTREAYAVVIMFIMLIIKVLLLIKKVKICG